MKRTKRRSFYDSLPDDLGMTPEELAAFREKHKNDGYIQGSFTGSEPAPNFMEGESMSKRMKPRKVCGDCSHFESAHEYDPDDEGRLPPADCRIPGCGCKRFRRAAPGERVKRPA